MVYHNGFYAMGTRFHIVFPNMEDESGDQVFRIIKNEVNRIESRLSRFTSDSEISKVNSHASEASVKVSREVYDILKTCRHFYDITKGAFNISLRPLLKLWHEQSEAADSNTLINSGLLEKLKMEHINISDQDCSVYFENDELEIDLGGFGKGYALEKVNDLLNKYSVEHAFLSFGESSVMTLGQHPAGDHWKIGIKDYNNPNQTIHTFHINNGSVSTSSNFFVDDHGKLKNHRHIFNPFTGCPVEEIVTISVCAKSAVTAEILSTAFLVMPDEEIRHVIESMQNLEIVKIDYTAEKPKITVY